MTTRIMTEPFLLLLQIADSSFPSGAFTHSCGLEQAARERRLTSATEVEAFAAAVLRQTLATADAPACVRAAAAAAAADFDSLLEIDRTLHRSKAAQELRQASLLAGRRQLEEVAPYIASSVIREYRKAVTIDRSLGSHAVVFGAVSAVCGVETPAAVAAYLQLSLNGMLQAAMRLLPVSHRDTQGALHRLRPAVSAIAAQAATGYPWPPRSFHPLQEIASMRHRTAPVRLFAS